MYIKYTNLELNKKPIVCKNCGSNNWIRTGRKWSCKVVCVKCKAERTPTFREFYGSGTVD